MKKIEITLVAYEVVTIEVENDVDIETFFDSDEADKVWHKVEDLEPEWAIDYEETYANQATKK